MLDDEAWAVTTVRFTPEALAALHDLDGDTAVRVRRALVALARDRTVDRIALQPSARVLNVGCAGSGEVSIVWRNHQAEILVVQVRQTEPDEYQRRLEAKRQHELDVARTAGQNRERPISRTTLSQPFGTHSRAYRRKKAARTRQQRST